MDYFNKINKETKILVGIILILFAALVIIRCWTPENNWICVDGHWVKHGNPSAAMPTEACSATGNSIKRGNIVVDSPKTNDNIGRHLIVTGSARVFESQFNWSVLDANTKKEITSGTAYANAADAGLFGPFEINTILPEANTDKIILQIFDRSAKDGSVIDLVEIPLNFDKGLNDSYQVYFSNDNLNPQKECFRVFPVIRQAGTGDFTIQNALESLFGGVSEKDKQGGYITNIPPNVKINSIKKSGANVTVDLSKDIGKGVTDFCRITAIRAQIYWTVIKSDTSARNVIISVEGDTKMFQP